MYNLAVDISDATKWESVGSLNVVAEPAPQNIRYRGRYLDHYPIPDQALNLIFDNHLLLVKAFSSETDKNYKFCGYLNFYARASGSTYVAKIFSKAIAFGETIIVVPRVGNDFTAKLEGIRYWLKSFSLQIFQYQDEAIEIEESQLLLIESSLISMSATLESLAGANP